MKFYHATRRENLPNILNEGIKTHCEGIFLCEKPEDAVKFLVVRGIKDILVLEVNIRKNSKKLIESFDHSYQFFKCRVFIYMDNIEQENISNYLAYKFN